MNESRTVRVALIGCGGLGRRHGENLIAMPGAQLVAISDPHLEATKAVSRIAEELGQAPPDGYSSHTELLAKAAPDAIVIASPNSTHRLITVAAAAAGAHVFCEKPMALSVADCDAMIDATQQAGVHLMVGYVRRFQPAFVEVKRLVDAGEIGDVRIVHANRLGAGPPAGTDGWRHRRDQYGGLYSHYSHELDQLAWIAGDISAVNAVMQEGSDPANTVEEGIFMGLEFASSAVGFLGCSRIHAIPSYELSIAGTAGSIKLTSGNPSGPILLKRHGADTVQELDLPANDSLVDEITDFVDGVRSGRKPTSDGDAGRRVVAVALAAHESARTGRKVQVP